MGLNKYDDQGFRSPLLISKTLFSTKYCNRETNNCFNPDSQIAVRKRERGKILGGFYLSHLFR